MDAARVTCAAQNAALAWLRRGMVAVMALGIFTHPIGAFAQLDANDPWPKYAHDERNTSQSPYRGPHSTPELRWWAQLTDSFNVRHTGGAAIVRVDGVRYIVVGTPANALGFGQPRVRVYRFHPTATYDPDPQEATPVVDIPLTTGESVLSTPLILPSVVNGASVEKRMVVQTQANLRAFNLDALPQSYTPALYDRWANSTVDALGATSPSYGRMEPSNSTTNRVIALADGRIHVLDPASPGSVATSVQLRADNNDYATPALGPAVDEPTRNLVYLPTWHLGSADPARRDMHALKFESGAPVVTWQSIINGYYFSPGGNGRFAHGSLGSASVHADGSVVVGSDDGGLYAFHNRVSPLGNNNERWKVDMLWFVSMTPGIFQPAAGDPSVVAWDEGGFVRRFYDHGSSATPAGTSDLPAFHGANQWDGAPAVDAFGRFYAACVNGRVYGFLLDPNRILLPWESPYTAFIPGETVRPFSAPIAVDEDGTLICVSDGYVLALRPLRGDFNGDGCRNAFDIDPFALALHANPAQWDAEYGAALGLNVLGIGDCNNDGLFNNFDIDCFADLIVNHPNCSGGDAPGGDDAEGADWAHFWEVIHALRQHYGME